MQNSRITLSWVQSLLHKKRVRENEGDRMKVALPAPSCFGTDFWHGLQLFEATITNTLLKSLCHVETSVTTFHWYAHIYSDAYSEEVGRTNRTVCSLNRAFKHTGAKRQTDEQVYSATSSPSPLISLTLLRLRDWRVYIWNRVVKGIDRSSSSKTSLRTHCALLIFISSLWLNTGI